MLVEILRKRPFVTMEELTIANMTSQIDGTCVIAIQNEQWFPVFDGTLFCSKNAQGVFCVVQYHWAGKISALKSAHYQEDYPFQVAGIMTLADEDSTIQVVCSNHQAPDSNNICRDCDQGQEAILNISGQFCRDCPIGKFFVQATVDVPHYSACLPCTEYDTSDSSKQYFQHQTKQSECLLCDGNRKVSHSIHGEHVACHCLDGYSSPDASTIDCTVCPAHARSTPANSLNGNLCECAPGYFLDTTVCSPCPTGTVKREWGNQACVACEAYDVSPQCIDASSDKSVMAICVGLNEAVDRMLALEIDQHTQPEAFANIEGNRDCVWIDVCAEQNYRQQAVPRDTWLLRGVTEGLWIHSDQRSGGILESHRYYNNIEWARIPVGVTLETCTPAFEDNTFKVKCVEASEYSMSGQCESASNFTVLSCLTPVFRNAGQRRVEVAVNSMQTIPEFGTKTYQQACAGVLEVSSNADFLTKSFCYWYLTLIQLKTQDADFATQVPSLPQEFGNTQMLRFSFEDDYSCSSDPPPLGYRKETDKQLHRHVSCPTLTKADHKQPHLRTTYHECEYECEEHYSVNAEGECKHKCSDVLDDFWTTTCADTEYALHSCSRDGVDFFICNECIPQYGKRTIPFSQRSEKSVCSFEACLPGTFRNGHICGACPIGTFSVEPTDFCTACNVTDGFYQVQTGQTECHDCFAHSPPHSATDNLCRSGEQYTTNWQNFLDYNLYLETFYPTNAPLLMESLRGFCQQGYACLPCRPGRYDEGSNTCTPCHLGIMEDYNLTSPLDTVLARSRFIHVGTYQPNFMQTSCFDCGRHQTSHGDSTFVNVELGTQYVEDCRCAAGFEL